MDDSVDCFFGDDHFMERCLKCQHGTTQAGVYRRAEESKPTDHLLHYVFRLPVSFGHPYNFRPGTQTSSQ
jgi:hypothetical protein